MTTELIVRSQAEMVSVIREMAESTIFSCEFIKRTTGELRLMVCRIGVKKGQAGGDAAYDFLEKGLLPVFDMQKQGYRVISLEGVQWIKIRGQVYKFVRESQREKVQATV